MSRHDRTGVLQIYVLPIVDITCQDMTGRVYFKYMCCLLLTQHVKTWQDGCTSRTKNIPQKIA